MWPLSGLFAAVVAGRHLFYRHGGWVRPAPVPVVVVGNLTVGGSGKTPLVVYLVQRLRTSGYRPGIVSRGYGAACRVFPRQVHPGDDPRQVGDEPLLLAERCGCPVVIDPRRPRGVQRLVDLGCSIVVADDGLQHYALARDVAIVVVDGVRRFGNGFCLPAGPLREPLKALGEADLVVANGPGKPGEYAMALVGSKALALGAEAPAPEASWPTRPLGPGWGEVHAVAGIGNPERFFHHLRRHGLAIIPHPFPDHHPFRPLDLAFGDQRPVLMTEKDAVKCRAFAGPHHWYVPVDAVLSRAFDAALAVRLSFTHR